MVPPTMPRRAVWGGQQTREFMPVEGGDLDSREALLGDSEDALNIIGVLGWRVDANRKNEWTAERRALRERMLFPRSVSRCWRKATITGALRSVKSSRDGALRQGQRTGALRFGDERVMALVGALCVSIHAVTGFTNGSLRALVAGLLGLPYSPAQMTYDLRRLRLKGLIRRLEHHNRYVLTPDGIKVAFFYTKLQGRLLRPLLAADLPPALWSYAVPFEPSNAPSTNTSPAPGSPRERTCLNASDPEPKGALEAESFPSRRGRERIRGRPARARAGRRSLLSGVTQSRQPEVQTAGAEPIQEAADVRRTAHRHDGDALGIEIPGAALRQCFERELVADPLDEYDRMWGRHPAMMTQEHRGAAWP